MRWGDGVRAVADGGFGRKVGEYAGKTILMGSRREGDEFCVVVYWNDRRREEGVLIATVDDAHGQQVHVDRYRGGEKVDREPLPQVDTVYEAEQYVKDSWKPLAELHFHG